MITKTIKTLAKIKRAQSEMESKRSALLDQLRSELLELGLGELLSPEAPKPTPVEAETAPETEEKKGKRRWKNLPLHYRKKIMKMVEGEGLKAPTIAKRLRLNLATVYRVIRQSRKG